MLCAYTGPSLVSGKFIRCLYGPVGLLLAPTPHPRVRGFSWYISGWLVSSLFCCCCLVGRTKPTLKGYRFAVGRTTAHLVRRPLARVVVVCVREDRSCGHAVRI